MSTQQVRNILNTQIDSVLVMAKNRIKEESKKKLNELKEQMPTPQEITKKLLVDINDNSCSDKGKEKFEKNFSLNKDFIVGVSGGPDSLALCFLTKIYSIKK